MVNQDAAVGGQFAVDDPGTAEDLGDMVQVEHEGQIYRVPAALQGAFMASAEQEERAAALAEEARGLDARRRSFAQEVDLAEQGLADRAQLHILDLQLEAFEDVDWEALEAEDPRRALSLWRQFEETRAARDSLARAAAESHDLRRLEAERERAAQLSEAGRVLSREIEGWSPEVARKLVEYAAAFGVTIDELREVADHRLWRILHRAYEGDALTKRQAETQAAEAAQMVRPAVVVGGAAAGSGGVRDELGTGEWMRRRNAQIVRG